MSKFKVGDIVRCIEDTGGTFGLLKGSIYTVINSVISLPYGEFIIVGTNDKLWVPEIFELV